MKLNSVLLGFVSALLCSHFSPSSARAVRSLGLRHGLPGVLHDFDTRAPPKLPKVAGGSGRIPPAPAPPPPPIGRPGGGSSSGGIGRPKAPGEASSGGSANAGSGIGRPQPAAGSSNAGGVSSPGKYELGGNTPPPDTPAAFTANVVKSNKETKDVSYLDQGRSLRDAWSKKTGADVEVGASQKLKSYNIVGETGQKLGGSVRPELAGPPSMGYKGPPAATAMNTANKNFVRTAVWGIPAGKGPKTLLDLESMSPVSVAVFSKDQRAIGIEKSTSKYATDFPLVGKDRLPQSEILFQNWKAVAGDKVADLKYVMHLSIKNEETLNIVGAALQKWNVKRGQVLTIEAKDTDPAKIAAFNALSGSDNGRAALRITTDHKTELGGIGPVKVHVFWDGSVKFPDLVWELGRVVT